MRTDVPLLTKRDFINGLSCPKRLYLAKFHRELETPPDEGSRARMADGNDIGAMARLMFPGGVLIEASGPDALLATEAMMQEAHTLFEAQFVSGGRSVRVDILQRDGDGWRLLEVKSSKQPGEKEKVKTHHLYDVAFQVLVLREAGVNVKSANLC